MLLLDITVVNVALPTSRGAPRLVHRPPMGGRRVRPDARERDAGCRHARRHARAEAGLPLGRRPLHPRLRPLRRGDVAPLPQPRARHSRASAGRSCSPSRSRSSRRSSTARSAAPRSGSGARRSALAVAIGPLVGGALTTWLGWRWIFFVNLPIGISLHRRRAPRSARVAEREHGGFDIFGFVHAHRRTVLARARAAARQRLGLVERREVTLFVAAVVLLVALRLRSSAQREPMLDCSLFRVPTFTGAQIVAFAISSAMFALFLYLTLYLQNVLGLSPIQAGLRFLPLSLVSFFVAPISGRLSTRLPVRFLLGGGHCARRARARAHARRHAELGLDDPAARLHRRRHRHRHGQPAARLDRGERRPAAACRDGVGRQQHVPAGRDRDGIAGARRDLPDQVEPARAARSVASGVQQGGEIRARSSRPERDPPRRGDRRIRGAVLAWCSCATATSSRADRSSSRAERRAEA